MVGLQVLVLAIWVRILVPEHNKTTNTMCWLFCYTPHRGEGFEQAASEKGSDDKCDYRST